ncbi:structure-specific endonuclease RAD27 [Lodderomyces elongisporus NRRL YB-4239]|uniref:Flap endonuclease 1 n=1 Tax=Lodderomyces elongisporus (strain ATCC 11503 / CBS 2605 / JCM 1781 / NBRC 1676 / NRRL YB-4239) TaxID=379508 RepID=FEN1_LODEL|nr:RecName: Full=Flap endonuclease 1; Short=FEN-1; AltName: Full=Flap structure-specific endonuclease 1 [Lodderomyces elongisporus NRRL YB-4239]EDK45129.1 structure-specific endonuclease RAD27 [Lodderomyces elongisporus NRRL YB-4239]
MGVKGLNQLIKEHSPHAYKEFELKNLFGRKVAIDASMCLYQFLIAVRQSDGQQLTNDEGETTSHLSGIFYRTIRMVENNIKPVYVFDGKPPVLKGGELEKRLLKREEAQKQIDNLKDDASVSDMTKYQKRLVRVSRDQNDEAKKLLELMGIPYVNAPCEAEAQCAELARGGKVFAAASEDMDTLCYEPPQLLRHLTFAEARKMPIDQITYKEAIQGLDMTKEQFIDLCILLGCDYCETIKGVGPVTAYKLIKEHGSLDNIVKYLQENPDKTKYKVPENWPYNEARQLFMKPEVLPALEVELKWKEPDLDGLIEYMVKNKGFSEDRIRSGAEKLKKGLKAGIQGRLDGFFTVVPKYSNTSPLGKDDKKRKTNDKKGAAAKKTKRR